MSSSYQSKWIWISIIKQKWPNNTDIHVAPPGGPQMIYEDSAVHNSSYNSHLWSTMIMELHNSNYGVGIELWNFITDFEAPPGLYSSIEPSHAIFVGMKFWKPYLFFFPRWFFSPFFSEILTFAGVVKFRKPLQHFFFIILTLPGCRD